MLRCSVVLLSLCFRLWWRKEMRKVAIWRSALDASWATSLLICWRRSLWHKNHDMQPKSLQHTLNIKTNWRCHCNRKCALFVSDTAERYSLWCICAFDTKWSMRKERLMIWYLKKKCFIDAYINKLVRDNQLYVLFFFCENRYTNSQMLYLLIIVSVEERKRQPGEPCKGQ